MIDTTERDVYPMDAVVFSIMMVAAAFLSRGHPHILYPHTLWCFLSILSFNILSIGARLKWMGQQKRALLSVGANAVFVTLILFYSGGRNSPFWVLYLLPIFTACLCFHRRGVLATTGAVLALLALFHAEPLLRQSWPQLLEMLIQSATLFASAGVTMRVALRERRARIELQEEQGRARQERVELQEKIQHMDRLATVGTLSASVTHELSNPVTSIIGFAKCLQVSGLGEGEMKEALLRIEKNGERCQAILQNLRSLSRRQKSPRLPQQPNALLRQCLELKKLDWLADGVQVEEDYDPMMPELALSGPEFQQVAFNLLANAQHALRSQGAGGGRVRVTSRLLPDCARFTIVDNGPGMPPEILDRIWEPFFTTKGEDQGTGLGLAISRQIVEEHGGTLRAQSRPGQGASFIIELPLLPSGSALELVPAAAEVGDMP